MSASARSSVPPTSFTAISLIMASRQAAGLRWNRATSTAPAASGGRALGGHRRPHLTYLLGHRPVVVLGVGVEPPGSLGPAGSATDSCIRPHTTGDGISARPWSDRTPGTVTLALPRCEIAEQPAQLLGGLGAELRVQQHPVPLELAEGVGLVPGRHVNAYEGGP